jgi:hypothetical protein
VRNQTLQLIQHHHQVFGNFMMQHNLDQAQKFNAVLGHLQHQEEEHRRAAKPLQIGLLRADELSSGVIVRDEDGAPRGRSVRAGRYAVATTVATRVVYLAPMLFLPYMHADAAAALPRVSSIAIYAGLAAASSAVFTPAALALFSHEASLPAAALAGAALFATAVLWRLAR